MRIRIQNPLPQSDSIKRHSLPHFFFRDKTKDPIIDDKTKDDNSGNADQPARTPNLLDNDSPQSDNQSLNTASESTEFIADIKEFVKQPPYNVLEFRFFDHFSKDESSFGALDNESNLGRIISDLELPVEEKLRVLTIPESARAVFCQHVIEEDETIPHPIYLLDCIRMKPHERLFIELDNCINRNRKSYRQIFIDNNGFELLMKYLLMYLNGTAEERQSTEPYLLHVLRCIENIINSILFGPNIFDDEMMTLLIKSTINLMNMDIPDDDFTTCLSIVTGSLLQSYRQLNIDRVDLTINMLDKSPQSFWACMINVIKMNHKHFNVVLQAFANRMLLENDHGLMECKIVLLFAREKFMDNLREMNNELFSEALDRNDEDYSFLMKISQNLDVNPFSIESILLGLDKKLKDNSLFYSISLSLYEMYSNSQIFLFIHNFLILCRNSIGKNKELNFDRLKLLASSALVNQSPIVVPYKGENPCTSNLNDKYFFPLKEDIGQADIEKYAKIIELNDIETQILIEDEKVELDQIDQNIKERDVSLDNQNPDENNFDTITTQAIDNYINAESQSELNPQLEIDQHNQLNDLISTESQSVLNLDLVIDQQNQLNSLINADNQSELNLEVSETDLSIQTDQIDYNCANTESQTEFDLKIDEKSKNTIQLQLDANMNLFEVKSQYGVESSDSNVIEKLLRQVAELTEKNKKLKNAAHLSNAKRFEQEAILAQLKVDRDNLDGYRIENEQLKIQLRQAESQIQHLKEMIGK